MCRPRLPPLSFCAALLRNPCRPSSPSTSSLPSSLPGTTPAFPKGDSTPLPEMSNPGRSHVVAAVNARTLRPWAEPPQTRVAHDSFGAYANARAIARPVCPARPPPPPCSFSALFLLRPACFSLLHPWPPTCYGLRRKPAATRFTQTRIGPRRFLLAPYARESAHANQPSAQTWIRHSQPGNGIE
ncbi:hypothetical protein MTO96_001072 [Rhipicephalus appendiculatus]